MPPRGCRGTVPGTAPFPPENALKTYLVPGWKARLSARHVWKMQIVARQAARHRSVPRPFPRGNLKRDTTFKKVGATLQLQGPLAGCSAIPPNSGNLNATERSATERSVTQRSATERSATERSATGLLYRLATWHCSGECQPRLWAGLPFLVPKSSESKHVVILKSISPRFPQIFAEFSSRTPERTPETTTAFSSFLQGVE